MADSRCSLPAIAARFATLIPPILPGPCRHAHLPSAATQGIERFGAGSCGAIKAALLPDWQEQAVRAQAARLLGTADLDRYQGWRGDRCRLASVLFAMKANGLEHLDVPARRH